MKKTIAFLILLISVANVNSANIAKRYTSRIVQDGICYFLRPYKLSKKQALKDFEYDVTFVSSKDSATLNFLFISDSPKCPDIVNITAGESIIKSVDFKLLYADITRKGYELRITTLLPYNKLKELFNQEEPLMFHIIQNGKDKSATYSRSQWKSEIKMIRSIFQLADINR